MNCPELYRCERCGALFAEREIVVDERDDRRCPRCGGLRYGRVVTRGDRVRAFLLDYNTA